MTGNRYPRPCAKEEVVWPDPIALRAFRAVLDPRHCPDRSAALTMWRRIANTDLATGKFGAEELQFIQTVAEKMIDADKLRAKERPDAVLAASGLYGRRREELDTRIEELMDILDAFEEVPSPEGAAPPAPTTIQKKYGKRDQSLAYFAEDPDIRRKVPALEGLRKRVGKVRDSRRKK